MSKWLGIVCVVACFGMGCGDDDTTTDMDAGPSTSDSGPVVETDSGPVVEADSGPVVETDAGPSMCDFDGTYGVDPVEGNPALCDMANIESCTLVTVEDVPTVTCTLADDGGDVTGECTYDADCICTGMTTVPLGGAEIPVTIAGDFPNMTLSAVAAGQTCNFTLTAM